MSNDKRYQVFVSSTFRDLEEERREVIQTLMQLDCIPAGMELFPAADEEQFEFIKRVIDDCDYYVLIIGGRYGSMTAEGVSYTEKEHDYAMSKKIPVIAFLHGEPGTIAADKSEGEPERRQCLAAFRDKVSKGRLVKMWKTPAELPGLVALSLSKTIKSHPRPGWVRGDSAANPELLAQLNELRQRSEQLQRELDNAREICPKLEGVELAPLDQQFVLDGWCRSSHENQNTRWEASSSWRQIVSLLGPDLLQPIPEQNVNKMLAHAILRAEKRDKGLAGCNPDVLATVKVQLMALGHIEVNAGHWVLTPTGRETVLRLRAVRAEAVGEE